MALTNLRVSVDTSEDVSSKDVQLDYGTGGAVNKSSNDFDPIEDLDIFATGDIEDELDVGDSSKPSKVNFNVVINAETLIPPNTKRYVNPILDVFDEKSTEFLTNDETSGAKKEARAKRFGLENEKPLDDADDVLIKNIYEEFEIDPNNIKHKQRYRLNALYLRGVEEMSTSDVFHYFRQFPPNFIEWINDISCVVVWKDKINAARALIKSSKRLKKYDSLRERQKRRVNRDPNKTDEISEGECGEDYLSPLKRPSASSAGKDGDDDVDDDDDDNNNDNDITMNETGNDDDVKRNNDNEEEYMLVDVAQHTVPPGHWRVGIKCDKSRLILIRFATIDDVKLRNAERRSLYYQKNGNPNYGGTVGLISGSRKRRMRAAAAGGGAGASEYQSRRRGRGDDISEFDSTSRVDDDLRVKLRKSHRWDEIRSASRRSSDEDEASPYSDDDDDDDDFNSRSKPKKFRMQMRADDVEKKQSFHRPASSTGLSSGRWKHIEEEREEGEILFDEDDEEVDFASNATGVYRRPGIDLRERLKNYRMKITVENTSGDEKNLSGAEDD